MQAGEAAPGRLVEAALPVEAPGAEREAMLLREQSEIADPHDRVLQMGRDHREVLLVERNEPQKFHDATPAFVIVRLR